MKPRFHLLLGMAAGLLTAVAAADCPFPPTAGVAICQPSPNSTIFQTPHIEVAVTPQSGSITDMKVFIDGKLDFDQGGAQLNLFEGAVNTNGAHTLMIDAVDGLGRHYQANETFFVTGDLPAACVPAAVGVRICSPAPGEAVPQAFPVAVGFKGNARISHVRIYVDSHDVFDFAPAAGQVDVLGGGLNSPSVGKHTLTLVAWDIHGAVFKSSESITAFFEGTCPPKLFTCTPGIYPTTPQDGDDVHSPFRVSAQVLFNTLPISAMKVYLNGRQVGESFGPVFDQPISAAKGTHIMVIQAWDTKGRLYRVTENVNVQ